MNSYAHVHAHRTNLLIHLVAVPLFILAHVGLFSAIAYRSQALASFDVRWRSRDIAGVAAQRTCPRSASSRALQQWLGFCDSPVHRAVLHIPEVFTARRFSEELVGYPVSRALEGEQS
jgi:hypothetical protein